MDRELKLPELAEGVEAAEVTAILVEVGDRIKEEQPVVELETGKATAEIPSPTTGQVTEVKVKIGDEIKVGQVILTLGDPEGRAEPDASDDDGESREKPPVKTTENNEAPGEKPRERMRASPELPEGSSEQPSEPQKAAGQAAPAPKAQKRPPERPDSDDLPPASGIHAPAAPSVRRFAREIGLDLGEVDGSGEHGRISVDDIKQHARRRLQASPEQSATAVAEKAPALPDFNRWGATRRQPLSRIRRETARHTTLAWRQIPHVTQHDLADVTKMEELRLRYATRAEKGGGKLTITPMLAKIAASALKIFPEFNCSLDLDRQEVIYKDYCHIGIAVDSDRGLLVPVLREVDRKNMVTLAAELQELAGRVRRGKIGADELAGGTFTISNLGAIGGTYFTPIVNWPQVAILGVGRARQQPSCRDGLCQPRLLLPLSLSYDHRVIDGAAAARFLRWMVEATEEPLLLSLEG